ncbi:MAG: L-threonylcarbamoyladenylate synthase [Methyloligellaceae bacterium]
MAITAATPQSIAEAARALRAGRLVAFPTETVYGLGADATNGEAVAAIFEAKGRPRFNPLIVHVPGLAAARGIARFPQPAEKLAAAFWPGPLTLVLPRRPESGISSLVTAGLDTIALRVPAHEVARSLLREAGIPVAAPSANRSGHVSATRAEHVLADLGEAPAFILDAGPTPAGLESTIVACTQETCALLRPGAIAREDIEAVLGGALVSGPAEAAKPSSPGQLESHYAPRAKLRLNATAVREGEALLAFGPDVPEFKGPCINLSPSGSLREAAAALFSALRALDESGAHTIAVMPIPAEGLGEAINDRLRRAAAPR